VSEGINWNTACVLNTIWSSPLTQIMILWYAWVISRP
jgi:hypothetical protein